MHGHVGAPRFFTYWREPALRQALAAAGWSVEEVEHGEPTSADRAIDGWLAVFAVRS